MEHTIFFLLFPQKHYDMIKPYKVWSEIELMHN